MAAKPKAWRWTDARCLAFFYYCQGKHHQETVRTKPKLYGAAKRRHLLKSVDLAIGLMKSGQTMREAIAVCCDGNAWWGEIAEELGKRGYKEWRSVLK